MDSIHPSILIYGAGAIGCTIAGWLYPGNPGIKLFARGQNARVIKDRGLRIYDDSAREKIQQVPVPVIGSLTEIPRPDMIILTVKNYSLADAAADIQKAWGKDVLIVALQNGIENQEILPGYFSRIIYGIVAYNAWRDEPGLAGYAERGVIVIGTPGNDLQPELKSVASVFNTGFSCEITDHLRDAVHTKIVINLANSVTALIGHGIRPLSSLDLLKKVTTRTIYEGICIMKKSGIREIPMGRLPRWRTLKMAVKLPDFITTVIFRKNVKKMKLSSMAQDLLINKTGQHELESLNGYILKLAEKSGMKAPFNRAIYNLAGKEFARSPFEPMDIRDVWAVIQKELKTGV